MHPVAAVGVESVWSHDRARPRDVRAVGGWRGHCIQLQLGPGEESHAIDVTLTPACAKDDDPTDRTIEVEGGCVTYHSSLPTGSDPMPSFEADGGLSLVPRSQLVRFVENNEDLILGGGGAPCP